MRRRREGLQTAALKQWRWRKGAGVRAGKQERSSRACAGERQKGSAARRRGSRLKRPKLASLPGAPPSLAPPPSPGRHAQGGGRHRHRPHVLYSVSAPPAPTPAAAPGPCRAGARQGETRAWRRTHPPTRTGTSTRINPVGAGRSDWPRAEAGRAAALIGAHPARARMQAACIYSTVFPPAADRGAGAASGGGEQTAERPSTGPANRPLRAPRPLTRPPGHGTTMYAFQCQCPPTRPARVGSFTRQTGTQPPRD